MILLPPRTRHEVLIEAAKKLAEARKDHEFYDREAKRRLETLFSAREAYDAAYKAYLEEQRQLRSETDRYLEDHE